MAASAAMHGATQQCPAGTPSRAHDSAPARTGAWGSQTCGGRREREPTMTSAAASPRDGFAGAGAAGAHDVEPFQASRPCAGEGRSRLRVLIASRQAIVRYGLRALV